MQQQQQQQRVSLHRGSSCPSLLATMPTATTTAHGYSSISLASDLYGHHSVDSQRVSMSSLIDPHQHNDQQQQQQQHHHHHHPHRRSSPTGSCHHLQQCPLTEENLKQHTLKASLGREGRHRRVKYYIESQIRLLRLQADLEGRRMAEMRSLVPLDTPSLEDEVIVLEDDYDLSLQQQPNEIIDHTKSSPQQQHRRKKRLSDARQWVMQRIFKKNNSSTKKQQHNNEDDPNVDHETSSSSPPRRRPASITVQPQHRHEDGLLENDQTKILSYEQYQHEKRALIGQGLSGLSNPNIARALGVPADDQHQASLASLLFSTSTSSSCTPPPPPVSPSSNSNPQQQQHHHVHCHSSTTPAATESQITTSASLSYQKRDSGVSVLSKPNHHHRHQHHRHPTSSSITANTATTMMEDAATRHHRRSNSKRRAQSMDSLVSVRYPKMVHVKVLRGAAIHALSSSDMSLATPPQPTDSIPDCCIMPDKSACCCSS